MSFEETKKVIEDAPMTWLPALLIHILGCCIRKKVFIDNDAIVRFIQKQLDPTFMLRNKKNMTKRFCDICGSPATKKAPFEVSLPCGKAWMSNDKDTGLVQPAVTIRANFVLRQDGFEGPPDLCASCVLNLMVKLQWVTQERLNS